MAKRPLRLLGLDRSGPPPAETTAGRPLRPWTVPNAIGYVRLALIPVFLVSAFQSGDGQGALPATLFAVIGWGDYADGIAARLTRQYSRLGALMDPLTDRLLVISGIVVAPARARRAPGASEPPEFEPSAAGRGRRARSSSRCPRSASAKDSSSA